MFPPASYGPNDMALDIWGKAREWVVRAPIKTYGSSGIGFVQFGEIDTLKVDAPIETFGEGARGYNIFVGSVRSVSFRRIVTHGAGGVGIQLASKVDRLCVAEGVARLEVRSGIHAFGAGSDAVVMNSGINLPLDGIDITASDGERIRVVR